MSFISFSLKYTASSVFDLNFFPLGQTRVTPKIPEKKKKVKEKEKKPTPKKKLEREEDKKAIVSPSKKGVNTGKTLAQKRYLF
jgi:hypothetical protein